MLVIANLGLRFLLEIAALVAAGTWGLTVFEGWPLRILAGIGLPLLMAAAWGIFRIPNDGGAPVVEVSPRVRLALEAVFFAIAVKALWFAGHGGPALALFAAVIVHYAIDSGRTLALAANRQPPPRSL